MKNSKKWREARLREAIKDQLREEQAYQEMMAKAEKLQVAHPINDATATRN